MLSVNSVSFAFQRRPLFSNIDFKLCPGNILHLTGANGTGKSTFMSIVAGYRMPTKGSIEYMVDGASVEDRREHIEYLSAEANSLYLKMDAQQNLKFWTSIRGVSPSQDILDAELKKWGLGHILINTNFPVEKFSTGMRRRLALARVCLSNTPCWLLDEPIYGLDEKGIALFRDMLAIHTKAGGMALIISHDTEPLRGLVTDTLRLRNN